VVILGGLSVLKAAFEAMNISRMQVSHSALREGVIVDLAGDSMNDNVRRNAVNDVQTRSHLHEVGLAVAHVQYHKHGDYLLSNADMLGFSRNDQTFIAALVRNHRRKIDTSVTQSMTKSEQSRYNKLLTLLRLATLFHRTRNTDHTPEISAAFSDSTVNINISTEWLEEHPLTYAHIEDEIEKLASIGIQLSYSSEATNAS